MTDAENFLRDYHETLNRKASGRWPAQWLDAFELEQCLKSSHGKEVYLARDRASGTAVILRSTREGSPDRADAEWDVLSKLDHPGIPKAFDSRIENGRSFIAREYFPGVPLDELVGQQPLPTERVRDIVRQVASILGYLHRQHPPVIHRDIKPHNIISRPDGSIGLTDFGIARTLKPGDRSDTASAGTMPYAPPEQYGYSQSTPQTDIYALGIVMIYLLTGNPDRHDLATRVPNAGWRDLIDKCIAFDPAKRPQSVEQVIRKLDRLGKPRRRRGILAVAGAGVIAVAVATVALVHLSTSAPSAGGQPGLAGPSAQSAAASVTTPRQTSAGQSPGTDPSSFAWPMLPPPPSGQYQGGGNYSGNLSNGGFAVGGDDGALFVATGTGIVMLDPQGAYVRTLSAPGARALNYFDGLLYFRIGDAVMRMNPDAAKPSELFNTPGENLYIDGGKLLYDDALDGLSLHLSTLDGHDRAQADDVSGALYRQVSDGWEFFSQGDDAELTMRELATGRTYDLKRSHANWSTVWGGFLYYTHHENLSYATHRIDLATGLEEAVTDQSLDFMVATDQGVFGMSPDNLELDLVAPGGAVTTLVPGNTGFFCVAGEWVFYQQGGLDGPIRMVKADGTGDQALPLA